MNYELAKKLKKAGFPQTSDLMLWPDGTLVQCCHDHCYCPKCQGDDDFACVPTLSELIEACGDIVLWKNGNKWSADSFNGEGEIYIDEYFSAEDGTTPEEAVANLWLALNNKHGTN